MKDKLKYIQNGFRRGPLRNFECGTYSGYQYHYRQKEEACDPCKKAANEYAKKYVDKSSPKYKERRHRRKVRRRARIRGNKAEPYTLQRVIDTYGTVCHICSEEIDMSAPRNCTGDGWQKGLHLDHVIPISQGGPDTLDNVKPAHAYCNVHKNK